MEICVCVCFIDPVVTLAIKLFIMPSKQKKVNSVERRLATKQRIKASTSIKMCGNDSDSSASIIKHANTIQYNTSNIYCGDNNKKSTLSIGQMWTKAARRCACHLTMVRIGETIELFLKKKNSQAISIFERIWCYCCLMFHRLFNK